MLSRRTFLKSTGTATAAAAALQFPASQFAWAEPRRVPEPGGPILLMSNENPYGPFPSMHAAVREAMDICNRYPDPEQEKLTAALATFHRVKPEQVLLGGGSTDILRMAAEAFCTRTRLLAQASPTFEALGYYWERRDGKVARTPLRPDWAHDLATLAKSDADLVYICNPNNPTATITPRAEIDAFLAKLSPETCVLIDEAYHDTAEGSDYISYLDQPAQHPRAFVARTFSKIYGMAGMRVGYAVGPEKVIAEMARFQLFDQPNALACRAAAAGLDDRAGWRAAVARNAADRGEFQKQAAARGVRFMPSHANFFMIETGRPVREVIAHFGKNNVRIGRPFPPLETHARISLGTPAEMREFWRVWDMLPAPGKS